MGFGYNKNNKGCTGIKKQLYCIANKNKNAICNFTNPQTFKTMKTMETIHLRPPSRILLTMFYLHLQGTEQATESDIFKAQDAAAGYFDNLFKIQETKLRILKRHRFTLKQWQHTLWTSHSLTFCPTERIHACNQEIKSIVRGFPVMNGTLYSENVFSGNLHYFWKSGAIQRTGKPFQYSLTDETLELLQTRISMGEIL